MKKRKGSATVKELRFLPFLIFLSLLPGCTVADYPYFLRLSGGELELIISADNYYSAWLDGDILGETTNIWSWQNTSVYSRQIEEDRHAIAVLAVNTEAVSGFIAEIRIDGTVIPGSNTPGNWYVTSTEPDGEWTSNEYTMGPEWEPLTDSCIQDSSSWTDNTEVPADSEWVWKDPDAGGGSNWFRFEF